ncbi:MAG TPA: NAD(P)H-binding protein [Bacteroidales bacterium]|nr:NAD(P)H-binding protein [Bacteroidales bacterium]
MAQTILGSGGGIGVPLARELKNYTDNIRLVSRNPKKVNETDQLFSADLNDLNQVDKAIAGSEVVYVTIGFEYSLKVWKKTWPVFIIKLLGIFIPFMREFPEMLYQYEQDYVFDSSKFEKRFGITATPPEVGIRKLIESLK